MRAVLLLVVLAACASGTEDPAEKPDARAVPDAPPPPDAEPGSPDAVPPPDAMTTPSGMVDTCAEALDLTAAATGAGGTTVTGDTTGYVNDVQPDSSCTGYTPDGPDAIYVVTATAGQVLTATVTPTPTAWDVSIYVTQGCTLTPTCLAGADVDAGGGPESVTHTVAANGAYHVVVDGWNPGVEGPYSLHVTLE